jgi:ABC-2 type transport system permease protein
MAIYLAFGALVLGFWTHVNLAAALIVFVPGALLFVSIGVLSSAFIVLVKQGDPVLIAFGAVTSLLGGLLFPVDALPGWVQPLTLLIPQTYALNGMRDALNGVGVTHVLVPAAALTAMLVLVAPVALLSFHWAIDRAKLEGSLAQY